MQVLLIGAGEGDHESLAEIFRQSFRGSRELAALLQLDLRLREGDAVSPQAALAKIPRPSPLRLSDDLVHAHTATSQSLQSHVAQGLAARRERERHAPDPIVIGEGSAGHVDSLRVRTLQRESAIDAHWQCWIATVRSRNHLWNALRVQEPPPPRHMRMLHAGSEELVLRDLRPTVAVAAHVQELVNLFCTLRLNCETAAAALLRRFLHNGAVLLVIASCGFRRAAVSPASVSNFAATTTFRPHEQIQLVEVLQPKAPGANGAAAHGSRLGALQRLIVVDAPAARDADRLVSGACANDSAHLLPLHFEGPAEGLVVEEPFPHLFLDTMLAEGSLLPLRQLDVALAPVLAQIEFAAELFATEVAAERLAQNRFPVPLEPTAVDECAGDVSFCLASGEPLPTVPKFFLPLRNGRLRKLAPEEGALLVALLVRPADVLPNVPDLGAADHVELPGEAIFGLVALVLFGQRTSLPTNPIALLRAQVAVATIEKLGVHESGICKPLDAAVLEDAVPSCHLVLAQLWPRSFAPVTALQRAADVPRGDILVDRAAVGPRQPFLPPHELLGDCQPQLFVALVEQDSFSDLLERLVWRRRHQR